jgi:hypothetical protein
MLSSITKLWKFTNLPIPVALISAGLGSGASSLYSWWEGDTVAEQLAEQRKDAIWHHKADQIC